jgi:transposase
MVRHRLTDQEWELVEDLFPPPARTGRPLARSRLRRAAFPSTANVDCSTPVAAVASVRNDRCRSAKQAWKGAGFWAIRFLPPNFHARCGEFFRTVTFHYAASSGQTG